MQNKITDLNNHLFAQLERLGDEDLTPEQLAKEIDRSKAISNVASKIVDASRVTVDAMKVMNNAGYKIKDSANLILGAGAEKKDL